MAATTKNVALMDDESALHVKCKEHLKKVEQGSISSGMRISHTLGQGTYGRVRLVEYAMPELEGNTHSGFFALKILKKSEILRLKQKEHVETERKLLLEKINHPFIVNIYRTYKDERNLFMLMEFVPGGELNQVLSETEVFSNDAAKFYAAQLVTALQYLHADGIVYRGLVPDNLIVDKNGYLKMVDFGFAKMLPMLPTGAEGVTYTLCGTAEYLAPEIVQSKGHGKGVDWWALGIVVYEMLAGYPPFFADNPFEIYQKILKGSCTYPGHFDPNLWEGVDPKTNALKEGAKRSGLLPRLLHMDRAHRIGCLKNGAEDIKKHKWFRGLNWAALYNKQLPAPHIPNLHGDDDCSCFNSYPDSQEESGPFLEKSKQAQFDFWC